MDKRSARDIASFPELFDGMEQFIAEQATGLKRTGTCLALAALSLGGLIAWWIGKAV